MAALLDCDQVTELQPVDPSMVITAALSGITVTVGNVKTPALMATWTPPESQYVVGIQFEYVDPQGRAVQTQSQRKDKAIWQTSDGIVAGAVYQVRYRATGIEDKAFGDWSPYQAIQIPAAFVAGDTAAVAGIPASTITARLVTVEGVAAANATAVSDLEAVYGDTVSAAASAAEAAQAASDAVQAKADAIIAQGQAQSASAEAILARADTIAAKNEAVSASGASASSAAQAGGFKNDAQTAAAAALQQKVEATAAREGAQAAANSPLATSPALSPDAFSVNSWATLNAPQNLREVFANNPGKIYPINSTVEVNNYGSAVHFHTAKAMARPEGHRFRYSARIRRMDEGGDASQNNVTLFAWFWDANGNQIGGYEFQTVSLGTAQGTQNLSVDHLPPAGTAWTRTMVRVYSAAGVTAVLSLDTQDIESEKTATAAATASVASAASAAASESAAGQSASASQQDRVAAQTARGQAEGFRDQSSASATTAAGAAATATEQAGLSAAARDAAQGHASSALTSRNQASGFVTDAQAAAAVSAAQKLEAVAARDEATAKAAASATSAANAAASETAAGLSATASQTARTGAETARGQAETYRNETASARDTAVGSAATATTQAGISASSATASQAAANTPLATSPAMSPDAFSINDWQTLNAAQNVRQVFADNPGKIYPINSTVEVNNFGSAVHINTAKAMARPEGHRVRYSARIRRMTDAGTTDQNHVTFFAWFWDANGNEIGAYGFQTVNLSTAQGVYNFTVDHLPPAGTAWTRTMVRVVSFVGVTAILSLDTQDIESEKTATAAATASVASASTASTKADEAGASASAASAAKIASELARDNAGGSASAAATSAGQSLTYRNQAGEFASASSGSATAANTAAGNAQTFASQASTSAGNANTAAINAGVSASYARSAVTQTIPNAPGLSPSGFATNQWTVQNYTGTHENLENKLAIEPSNYSVVGGNLRITNMDTVHIHACRATSRPSGHKVRCSTTFRRITDGGDGSNNRVTLYAFGWDAAGNVVAAIEITSAINPTVTQGVQKLTYDLSDDNLGANCVFLRTMTRVWSATGATDVISIDTEDVQSEAAAANSAAIATSQAASASASASSASLSANLAATVGSNSSLVNNGRFINWPSGQARPTGWHDWANCNQEPNIQAAIGWNGRRFARMNYQPWMNDQGMRQDIDGFRGSTEPYNLDVEVAIPFGGANGTGFFGALVLIQCLDANGNYLGDADAVKLWLEKDINGNIPGAGNGDGRIYRFNKRINLLPNTRVVRIYPMSRWTVVGPPGANEAKTLDWYSVSLTPMSGAESSVPGLAAQLQITAATTADIATRMATAKFEVVAAAGSDPAQLLIRADNSGSLAALVASEISFSNVVGGAIVRVMRIIGGNVFITGKLYIGGAPGSGVGYILLDGPNMRIDMFDEADVLKMRIGKLS